MQYTHPVTAQTNTIQYCVYVVYIVLAVVLVPTISLMNMSNDLYLRKQLVNGLYGPQSEFC